MNPDVPISAPTAAIQRGEKTILVVEDNDSVRELTALWLRRQGYHVLEADSGVAALERWSDHEGPVALLLTDLILPEGITGLELAHQLRKTRSALKVIVTNGYNVEFPRAGTPGQRGVSYLLKPYDATALAIAVRKSLDEP